VQVPALGYPSDVTSVLYLELFCPSTVRRPSFLGEKVGAFFEGRGGCLHYDGEPGDGDGRFTLLAYILDVSSLMFDQADGRGSLLQAMFLVILFVSVSCKLFLQHYVLADDALLT
jgi:hypothetical protein